MTQSQENLLRKIYSTADEDIRRDLENDYPELFAEPLFKFEPSFTVNLAYRKTESPLVVAFGFAPSEDLMYRCLTVHNDFKAELFEFDSRQYIKFVIKRK